MLGAESDELAYVVCPTMGDQVPVAEDVSGSLEPGACAERMLVTRSELDDVYSLFEQCSLSADGGVSSVSGLEHPSDSTIEDDEEGSLKLDASQTTEDTTSATSADDDEDLSRSSVWRAHDKHVFIFSESGKPIYCRHGDEQRLVTLFGVMQALVAFVIDAGDVLHHVRSDTHLIVFLSRRPLTLVAATRGAETVRQLALQLSRVYDQTLSVVTLSQLRRISEQRRNFDFRKLVSGAERYLDHLLNSIDQLPIYLLESVECLRMEPLHRETITAIVQTSCRNIKNLLFALIVCGHRLVCLVRMKKLYLHPSDFQIICNAVVSTEAFKSAEGWMPMCLPKLDPNAFLYAHISYLSEGSPACLAMLTSDRDSFHRLSKARAIIQERLSVSGSLERLAEADRQHELHLRDIGLIEMRHFMYKCTSTAQLVTPAVVGVDGPYGSVAGRRRLARFYHVLHGRLHAAPSRRAVTATAAAPPPPAPLRTCHVATSGEQALGWLNGAMELYAVLEPYVSVTEAVALMNRLLRWIYEHERSLFIMGAPVF